MSTVGRPGPRTTRARRGDFGNEYHDTLCCTAAMPGRGLALCAVRRGYVIYVYVSVSPMSSNTPTDNDAPVPKDCRRLCTTEYAGSAMRAVGRACGSWTHNFTQQEVYTERYEAVTNCNLTGVECSQCKSALIPGLTECLVSAWVYVKR